jgi:hypothetical protein
MGMKQLVTRKKMKRRLECLVYVWVALMFDSCGVGRVKSVF